MYPRRRRWGEKKLRMYQKAVRLAAIAFKDDNDPLAWWCLVEAIVAIAEGK